MQEQQISLYDIEYEKYKITKPIRLIELFAGYGSQALALKYLGVPFEHWKICEWAVKSIQAYKDIHFADDSDDYSMLNNLSYEELIDILYNYGISQNYNEPMKLEQIKRLGEKQVRKIFNNIVATNNLVNIQKVKGYSLEIQDTDKYCYIMTYSFPCQDLSLAGKGKGMSDTSTRSGMLWEVERILQECKDLGTLPQVLLMENVPQVHSQDNLQDFNKWQLRLEELGYHNYWQDLIATDYGIPQTRNRCFMVSILGEYNYTFPKPIPLKLKLKDMLEENVNDKYNISNDLFQHICKTKKETKEYTQYKRYHNQYEQLCRVWKEKSPTLHTICDRIKIYDYIGTFEYAQSDTLRPTIESRTHINNKTSGALLSSGNQNGIIEKKKNIRIRKLTPKECFRLMGVKDEDYLNCARNQNESSLYHLAGDSIVVNVLMAIFKELI